MVAISSPPEYNTAISRYSHLALEMQWLEEEKVQNLEEMENMIMRDGNLSTVMQQKEEDEAQKPMEK